MVSTMRILMISPLVSGIGGIAQHVSALVRGLTALGHTVRVLSSEGLPTIRVRRVANASFALAASFAAVGRKYDVIHAHNVPSALPMRLAKGRRILTIHGVFSESLAASRGRLMGWVGRKIEKWAVRRADVVTAVSKSAVEYYQRLGIRAVHVPNGIDLSMIPAEGERLYPRQVIYVGRLSREKGVDVLIRAMSLVEGAHLIVVGSGPEEDRLRRLASGLGRVRFMGFLPRKQALRLVKGSDVFVLPSRTEGLSTALLEAMACGTPVVATAVGGNVELLQDGVTGLLVPPDDHEALGKAILRLLGDGSLRRGLSSRAREVVEREYDMGVVVRRYLEVYSGGLGP